MKTKKTQARSKAVNTAKELKKLQSLWLRHLQLSVKAYNACMREMRKGNEVASDKYYAESQKEMKAYEKVHKKWALLSKRLKGT